MTIAIKEIEAERARSQDDEELQMLGPNVHGIDTGDSSYHSVATTAPYNY